MLLKKNEVSEPSLLNYKIWLFMNSLKGGGHQNNKVTVAMFTSLSFPLRVFCSIILRHAREKIEMILFLVCNCLAILPANSSVGITNESGMMSPLSFLVYRAGHS